MLFYTLGAKNNNAAFKIIIFGECRVVALFNVVFCLFFSVAALADKGYDIWLLNYRGSFYGKKHVQLDPIRDAEKFWDFT